MKDPSHDPYIKSVSLLRKQVPSFAEYPFSIPAIRNLRTLKFHSKITFIIGENGSGKSTLLEALAVALGFNAEGGSKNIQFSTRQSHSKLNEYLNIDYGRGLAKPKDGFFLRAESYFNFATELEKLDDVPESTLPKLIDSYGKRSLHEQSHGESFLALLMHRLHGNGIFLFDEPEAALSPKRQLACLALFHQLVANRSQLIVATHSPILMAYPDAYIYECGTNGLRRVQYDETEHYVVTREFLNKREKLLSELLED